ncbi:hypothetical protein KFE25_008533 [Diacronema lutheri]|uniref:Uncharacterized protein n=1 Tax=Diacronema lutheri TaxID=2081491 RepID=A0A8J5XWT9_DIALT|nr:hypothetical protein KFE25_008533 [Diacronema lutheri]
MPGLLLGVRLGTDAAKALSLGARASAPIVHAASRALGVVRALWAHRLATPFRWALVPFNWFFGKLITGDWVPSGPWMVIWMLLGFASSIQDYKRLLKLTMQLLMQKEGAACALCDSLMGLILKFDENSPEDIDCSELCPFGIKSCLSVCTSLIRALKESSRYPCVSIGMCPDVDEPPECVLRMPFFACEPRNMCRLVPAFPRPRCELLPGLAVWNKWKGVIQQNVGAFAFALAARPYCSDAGASPHFCVTRSTGVGFVCEVLALLLVVLAFFLSIHALETDGWDDDKQWLTFWIITFCLAVFERLTDVILSRYDTLYYGAKLGFVVWLIFFRGAERAYTRFRAFFVRTARLLDEIDRAVPQVQMLSQKLGALPGSAAPSKPKRLTDVVSSSRVAQKVSNAFRATVQLAAARPASLTTEDHESSF